MADANGPDMLMESSRANLILQGMLPPGEDTRRELEERLLSGRLYELRMLFFLGKDIERWVEQCSEYASQDPSLRRWAATELSFCRLLVDTPPRHVQEKLQTWGVVDSRAIFTRAIGLRTIFEDAPSRATVTAGFIRDYYRYADQVYRCRMEGAVYPELPAHGFVFELYASGEYTRMLEQQWEAAEPPPG